MITKLFTKVRSRKRCLIVLILSPALAVGQSITGSVSGHIDLADSQQPARFARVVLVPLPSAPRTPSNSQSIPQRYPSETHSDGGFQVADAPPGDYYVSATYPGYLSPEYQFSANDLLEPTPAIRKRIIETLPTVTVSAGKQTTISLSIHRGAAISGTLCYDDGSPIGDVEVLPLQRSASGSWVEIKKSESNARLFGYGGTDDLGHFRIPALAPGEYTLKVSPAADYQRPLAIFYGDVFFQKDAKSIQVIDGEEHAGADITIRLTKLHTISGSLVDGSGQPINSGQISILSGTTKIAGAFVHEEDATFRIDMVPEGVYTLRVTEARNVNRRIVRDAGDPNQISDIKQTILQTYGDYEVPLEVISDVPNLTLTLPSRQK